MNLRPVILTERPSPHTPTCGRPQSRISRNGGEPEKLAPEDAEYRHEATWNDDNGHAHVRASLLGPSLTIPFVGRRLQLGTWQQIVLIDFDTRPRIRRIIVQVMGD